MQTTGNTILVTGGSSGIGMGLAERLLAAKNEVIVCARGADRLAEVKRALPGIHTLVGDTGSAAAREALHAEVTARFPAVNVLVNNAGIQRKVSMLADEPWAETASEIAINLEGPIHLARLFLPQLRKQARPVIANVTSGLAFVPIAGMPVYCATKAALHSFTLSLRHQLAGKVEVIEIIPPAVRTNLGGSHDFGEPLDVYCDAVMAQLAEGRPECTYGFSAKGSQASRAELDGIFANMNAEPRG